MGLMEYISEEIVIMLRGEEQEELYLLKQRTSLEIQILLQKEEQEEIIVTMMGEGEEEEELLFGITKVILMEFLIGLWKEDLEDNSEVMEG